MKCLFCLVAVFLLAAPAYGSTDPPTTTPAAGSCMSEIQTCSTTYANDAAGKTSEEDFCPVYDAFVECVEDGCTADELSGMSAWKDAAEEALEDLGFDCSFATRTVSTPLLLIIAVAMATLRHFL